MVCHADNRIQEVQRLGIGQVDGIAASRLVGCRPGHLARCKNDTNIDAGSSCQGLVIPLD